MLTEERARELAERAIERLGGVDALERLFEESHTAYPEHEMVIGEERVIVRLREEDRPATVYVGPYTFELRDHRLVNVTTA